MALSKLWVLLFPYASGDTPPSPLDSGFEATVTSAPPAGVSDVNDAGGAIPALATATAVFAWIWWGFPVLLTGYGAAMLLALLKNHVARILGVGRIERRVPVVMAVEG